MSPEYRWEARLRAGSFELDVQVEVERGPVAVVGPNGAGKSTLLRALAGGEVEVRGELWAGGRLLAGPEGVLPPEERDVGYLPQGDHLFPHLGVLGNVAFGSGRVRALQALERVGLAALADRRTRGLSGGERRRVALARALARRPSLLLLDEPTAALDVRNQAMIRTLLDGVLHAGPAVVITHDLRDLLAWRPTLVLVEDGRARVVGTVDAPVSGSDFLGALLAPPGISPGPRAR